MIRIARPRVRELLAHLEGEYPKEACGVLWGRRETTAGAAAAEVLGIRPLANADETRSFDRYLMDPKELLEAEKEARAAGAGLVGIYHSHPDRPAQPSPADLDQAWPVYAYLIVSVRAGSAAEWACWTLDGGGGNFRPCPVRLEG